MAPATRSRSKFSDEQVKELHDAAPMNWDKCHAFSVLWGVSPESIRSKVSYEMIDYENQALPAAKPSRTTKKHFVEMIERALKVRLDGLDGASRTSLSKLANAVVSKVK